MIKYEDSKVNVGKILECFLSKTSIILFSFYEKNLFLLDKQKQEFVLDRVKFSNSEWILPWSEPFNYKDQNGELPTILWYIVSEPSDIMRALEVDFLFRCIILENDKDFSQYSNILFNEEYYNLIDEDEDYDYYLGFTNKQSFFFRAKRNITRKI